jgi:hypothetical protein
MQGPHRLNNRLGQHAMAMRWHVCVNRDIDRRDPLEEDLDR